MIRKKLDQMLWNRRHWFHNFSAKGWTHSVWAIVKTDTLVNSRRHCSYCEGKR